MTLLEGILNDVKKGAKILVPQQSRHHAHSFAMEVIKEHPDMLYRQHRSFVEHKPSGGFIHLAVDDAEVIGREYHQSVGSVTSSMRARVRLTQ